MKGNWRQGYFKSLKYTLQLYFGNGYSDSRASIFLKVMKKGHWRTPQLSGLA